MKKILMLMMISLVITNLVCDEDSKPKNNIAIYTFFINIVNEPFPYPLIGFVNLASGSHKTLQMGFLNYNEKDFKSLQLSFVNYKWLG